MWHYAPHVAQWHTTQAINCGIPHCQGHRDSARSTHQDTGSTNRDWVMGQQRASGAVPPCRVRRSRDGLRLLAAESATRGGVRTAPPAAADALPPPAADALPPPPPAEVDARAPELGLPLCPPLPADELTDSKLPIIASSSARGVRPCRTTCKYAAVSYAARCMRYLPARKMEEQDDSVTAGLPSPRRVPPRCALRTQQLLPTSEEQAEKVFLGKCGAPLWTGRGGVRRRGHRGCEQRQSCVATH